ncbi:MAG: methyltransferase domain-containing protein [Gammaproteobacteria bacterium]|nr:methyltransferase domain-containing protein [Gammaproteobacteria bacterium]MCP5138186.1 methyltransferase domain-containing protein [Gammaproteobacteria bacterium]
MSTSNTHTAAGSYAFGSFDENQKELDRLKQQAAIATALERQLLSRAGLREGMDVLDMACGPGIVSCEIARMVGNGRVTGVDLSPDLLKEAQAAADAAGLTNLRFQQANVYELDLGEAQFDFIYARFLFQHLEHPERAFEAALRTLKPGGILAILDIDDDWLTLFPEPETFTSFTQRAAQAQQARGGDRHVGRKLGTLLARNGFDQVGVFVHTVTSADLGMRNFLDITTGFKLEQLSDEQKQLGQAEEAVIRQISDDPEAWGFAAVFVATGHKPTDHPG